MNHEERTKVAAGLAFFPAVPRNGTGNPKEPNFGVVANGS